MYKLIFTKPFQERLSKITFHDKSLKKKLRNTFQKLAISPLHLSLRSHKVQTRHHGTRWSSWVTGDTRIVWDYLEDKKIVLLDIGSHGGKRKGI